MSDDITIHWANKKEYNRYKTALDVQDAVNLVALSREFVKVVQAAYEERSGTVSLRDDPAIVLFVNKFESMCRSEARFTSAYEACRDATSDEVMQVPAQITEG